MADVTERLPAPLSKRIAGTSSQIGSRAGQAIDHMIAGIPFLSASSAENPFIIETAEMKRDQFDNESEPGEQSLQGWWLRSQDSWHEGAGARFQEPRDSTAPSARFYESSGVDVWEEGQLTLLRRLEQSSASSTAASCLALSEGALYMGVGPDIRSIGLGAGGASTQLDSAAGETWADITVGREAWYAITNDGVVHTRPIAGGAVKTFTLTNADTFTYAAPRLAWAKHRLWATFGRRVYVVDTTAASGTVTPLYSHPTTDWSYTDISEGPACVYLSGWSDAESGIQKVTLTDDGTIPTLSAGITTAVLPAGERVQRLGVLAGTWVGIATNKGFRIGVLDQNGDIQYGPLTLQPKNVSEAKAVTAWDRWFYASWQTTDSLGVVYRIDASQAGDDGSFPWARDVETDSPGYFSDLLVTDGRVVGAFNGGNYPVQTAVPYWYQHETELVEQGTITFGQIRFRTTEPKLFKYIAVELEPLAGTITVDSVLPGESLARLGIYSTQGKGEFEQISLPANLGPQRSMGFLFTLGRHATDPTRGPIIHSYSVKSIPAVKPQRLIQLPLLCFDREMWPTGLESGRDGWARDRLAALQMLEDDGDLVIWQDMSQEDATGRQVKIDKVSFSQTAPQHATTRGLGYGGVVTLLLRTMD